MQTVTVSLGHLERCLAKLEECSRGLGQVEDVAVEDSPSGGDIDSELPGVGVRWPFSAKRVLCTSIYYNHENENFEVRQRQKDGSYVSSTLKYDNLGVREFVNDVYVANPRKYGLG
jgi:hypothetical protein